MAVSAHVAAVLQNVRNRAFVGESMVDATSIKKSF